MKLEEKLDLRRDYTNVVHEWEKSRLTSSGSGSIDENFRFKINKSSRFIPTVSSAFDI